MGRRKQSRPHRSVILGSNYAAPEFEKERSLEAEEAQKNELKEIDQPYFVEVDRSGWGSDDHLDVSEVVLLDLSFGEEFSGRELDASDFVGDDKYSMRFRLCNVDEYVDRIKLGHWPVLSSAEIFMEFVEKCTAEGGEDTFKVILSGSFDGPNEGVSGLVHVVSLKFLTLRPVMEGGVSTGISSLRMRVEVLRSAFDACESLLENTRKLWKKSMMNVMAWLRPEVMTSEARYGVNISVETDSDSHTEIGDANSNPPNSRKFDVAGFYEAIKPSKTDAMLEEDLPDLLPELRPYQRRAAHWMVQRETQSLQSKPSSEESHCMSPLCLPVRFLNTDLKMFYNPFSGNVSLRPEHPSTNVVGGILADEMGLGKTVELLACIFAHPKAASEGSHGTESQDTNYLRRLKKERVECVCGAVSDSYRYKGLWVQCDVCDAWQHADCVGYSSKGKPVKSTEDKAQNHKRKKNATSIVERDGQYICPLCSELIEATDSPITSGATLIVCPAPILPQWHAEINRHTRPGSLKTYVYDGVRDTSLSNKPVLDIGELINADIVLTTYDVLKEDLSHDSDRHEGDRRFMRFQKRYPVVPTYLTRISWWRVCLDEAQMVESNATSATEMALRLHAKYRWCITGTPIQRKLDDLYGLLRFLKASPFDVSRWWIEVMREPYERKDAGAMEFVHKFFKQIMWRSSKVHVADELQLPPQEECTSWLTFSPIEEHFYQRQHETCASFAREVVESLKDDILKRKVSGSSALNASSELFITHAEAGKLLNTLLKLRQACCHPQVGSSGLRSLQQSPMTMEEILMVLISKTKIEGEESLRRVVLALNGLAGIAIIEENSAEAASLYKEALALAEEHSEDFRLDPLLNIHIHHNLAEVLPQEENCKKEGPLNAKHLSGSPEKLVSKRHGPEMFGRVFKRRKLCKKENCSVDAGNPLDSKIDVNGNFLDVKPEGDDAPSASCNSFSAESIRATCENMKQKYLSAFSSRLYVAQQEFRKSHMQVCSAIGERKNQHSAWWLEALLSAEQNKDFSAELIRKIGEAISESHSKSPSIPSGFRSINALKYHIQSLLDHLEASRKVLLDRLLEIDRGMENPKDEDIERVRYCKKCKHNADGPLCVTCELDELFQQYEVRLFRLKKVNGAKITSAEEAVDSQKKNTALNRFYSNLSQSSKTSNSAADGYEESRKRDVQEKVNFSKAPSDVEVILGVIKNHCKAHLGRESSSAATKHLNMLAGMRKEFDHSRALEIAQTQVLQAHDEIKMATTRIQLQGDGDDKCLKTFTKDELPSASVQYTSDKFVALNMLSCIKGKLRYLKGLVAKQKVLPGSPDTSSLTEEEASDSANTEQKSERKPEADEESCPVCQETLSTKKMVFQCGHVTCCTCLFALTEWQRLQDNTVQHKWVPCPTCRQHTDFGHIAYIDDRQSETCSTFTNSAIDGPENWGSSIVVQGSYGTKIEAVTRRVLWIKSKNPEEKVLVFSSWNDVLDVLQHAFAANNISYVRMKGGRKSHVAISKFRGEKMGPESVQVLLLLIQHGANGLNLLEAQHVVLVEPLLNPAAEAQAISRVHRLGQKKGTLVHRFIVKNTVEESIYKLNRSRNTASFISRNPKNQDQSFLTLKDVESLFATAPTVTEENPAESLRHLPPSVAAAIAAERRLNNHASFSSSSSSSLPTTQ